MDHESRTLNVWANHFANSFLFFGMVKIVRKWFGKWFAKWLEK